MKRTPIQTPLTAAPPWRRFACLATLALGLGGFTTPAQADYASTVATFNPVAYWRLNETASSTDDAFNTGTGGPALNGAYVNLPTKEQPGALAGPSGTAVIFNGTQKAQIPWSAAMNAATAGLADPFTVEAWVKSNAAPAGAHIIVQSMRQPATGNTNDRSGWFLREVGTDLVFAVGTPTGAPFYYYYTVAGVVSATDWQHVAVVYDGDDTPTIYLNGVAQTYVVTRQDGLPFNVGEQAAIRVLQNTDYPAIIGDRGFGGWGFNGTLDEVAIYPSALDLTTVAAHYTNGLDAARTTPYETLVGTSNPVGYYRLDDPPLVLPTAVNSGSLLAAADGLYSLGTFTKTAGPPAMAGLGAGNFAVGFDGTGHINSGNDIGLDVTQISVAGWIKVGTKTADMNVIARGSALWRLQLNGTTNQLKWVCPGGGVTGTKNVADGLWHHVVAVAGSNGSALYVDGSLDVADPTAVPALSGNADPLTIGSNNLATNRWNGALDELAVFPAELTAANVLALYLAAEPPFNSDITSFGPSAVITGNTISWMVPYGSDVTTLAPTYTVSPLATQDPLFPSGTTRNFTTPQTYTITSYDNVPKVYTVTAVVGGGLLVSTFDTVYGTGYLDPIANLLAVPPSGTGIQFENLNYPTDADFMSLPGLSDAEGFAVLWEGWLAVTKDGTGDYTFATASDDGSVLFLDLNDDGDFTDPGERVVNNNRDQGTTIATATVALTMNSVHMAIGFYEGGGVNSMAARFKKGTALAWDALQPINGRSGHFFPVPLTPTITGFSIAPYGDATIKGNQITLNVPYGDSVTALTPTITSNGASVSPASGVPQDFTLPVTYTVTATDTSTKEYQVAVRMIDLPVVAGLGVWLKADAIQPNDATQGRVYGSTSFVTQWNDASGNSQHASQATAGVQPQFLANNLNGLPTVKWDGTGKYLQGPSLTPIKTIFAVCKKDAEATGLDGLFCASPGQDNQNIRGNATVWNAISNGSTNSADFAHLGPIHVNGTDSATHNSQWHILMEESTTTPLFTYQLGQTAYNRYLNGRIAEIILYDRALTTDERNAVGGYLADKYALSTAYPKPAPQAKLYAFGIPGWPGVIDQATKTVSLTVPFSMNVTALAPTYTVSSGATGDKASGSTHDFTTPVIFTLTSSDSLVSTPYTVTVIKAPARTDKELVAFGPGAIISGTNVSWTAPYGSNLAALNPSHVVSVLATGSPASGATVNFTNPVTYTVTAEDGSTQAYTVAAKIAPSPPTTRKPALWLDASQLEGLTDGQVVNAWPDTSGSLNFATRTDGAPAYKPAIINGKPVVRFDSGSFGFSRISTIRSVFWVLKENAGAAAPRFLLGDTSSYNFHRGDGNNGPLWHGTHTHANIRNGTTKLMGTPVNGTATSMPAGTFQVISAVTTGNVEANTLSSDRNTPARSWNGDIAEVLIYDTPVTSAEETEIGSYLSAKYGLATGYPAPTPLANLYSFGLLGKTVVVDQTTKSVTLEVPYLDVTAIPITFVMSGGASCDKVSGANQDFSSPVTYTVKSSDDTITNVYTVTVAAAPKPPSATLPVLWLDASKLTGLSDGQQVNSWRDSSGMSNHANRAYGSPVYKAAIINDLPVVRFGTDSFNFPRISTIRSVFWVLKENIGASQPRFLLGDSGSYHFHRSDGGPNGPLWSGWTHPNILNGTTRLMGTPVNGAETPLPGGTFQLVSLVTAGNVEANNITDDRNIANRSWNGDIAEILIYDKALSSAEEAQVGNYLTVKYGLSTGYPYLAWAAGYPGFDLTIPAADADGDGRTNQDEFAFGLNPTRGSSVNPITVPLDKATGRFSYTRRNPALTGLTYRIWTSTDLVSWSLDSTAAQAVTATAGDVQTIGVTLTTPPTAPKFFVRVTAP
jgi:hypothetical protein